MRLRYIVERFPTFSETFIADEVLSHFEAGLDVEVVVLTGETESDFDVAESKLHGKVPIHFLGFSNKSLFGYAALALRASLKRPESLVKFFGLRKLGLSAREVFLGSLVASKIKNTDILHCHFGNIGRIGFAAKALINNKSSLFVTFHAHDLTKQWYLPLSNYYSPIFNDLDTQLLPISSYWKSLLLQSGAPVNRTTVQHVGVDVPEIVFSSLNSTPNILMIGRLVEKKGHYYALQAFAKMKAKGLVFRVKLVGGGPLQTEICDQIENLSLANEVSMTGSISHSETLRLFEESDIFVLPSVTAADGDQEGIPVVLMEAMARCIAVVSTHHTGIPELVDDGINGYLVDERDPDTLADRVAQLCLNVELRNTFGQAGRKKVQKDFLRKDLSENLRELYKAANGCSRT